MNDYFKAHPAEYELRVQLNTGLDEMPIEEAQAEWPETESQYRTVARLTIPGADGMGPGEGRVL